MTALHVLAVVAAFAAGAVALPFAVRSMVRRKGRKLESWWGNCSTGYLRWLEEHGGRSPEKRLVGFEGDLAVWAEDAERLARCGELEGREIEEARHLGLDVAGAVPRPDGEGLCSVRDYRPSAARRVVDGAAVAAVAMVAIRLWAGYGESPAAAAVFFAAGSVAVAAAELDVAERIIPWEASLLVFSLAFVRQLLLGPGHVLPAAFCALAAAAAFYSVRGILSLAGRPDSIGAGDLRMAPALAFACGWPGFFWGALAALPLILTMAAVAVVRGRGASRRGFPFGPVLAVWIVGGMALGTVLAT